MRSVGMIEINGIKKLNCIEVHTCNKDVVNEQIT